MHHEEYEKNIIGCFLEHGSLIDTFPQLQSEHFYSDRLAMVHEAMMKLRSQDVPIDEITVRRYMKEKGLLDKFVGFDFVSLGDLRDKAILHNIEYHIGEVIKAFKQRKASDLHYKLSEAYKKGDPEEAITKLKEEIERLGELGVGKSQIVSLAKCEVKPREWFLKGMIPDKYPTILYGDGGLGKSFLGLTFGIMACQGGMEFFGYEFPIEPKNVLYLDWELEVDEIARRAKQISNGLRLSEIPCNLSYLSPSKSLPRFMGELKAIIKSKDIQFLIIDSLGMAGVDPDKVMEVIEVMTRIKKLGIATLVLDHQSKMQSKDNYNQKTPHGSVYKRNLSRSAFQLSRNGDSGNPVTLMLQHKKANFGSLQDDLIFDISFEGDRVTFYESQALSPDKRDMAIIREKMIELESRGGSINQKNIISNLKGILGRDRIISLLGKGKGEYWEKGAGNKNESVYKSKTLKNGCIYSQDFRVLENSDENHDVTTLNDSRIDVAVKPYPSQDLVGDEISEDSGNSEDRNENEDWDFEIDERGEVITI